MACAPVLVAAPASTSEVRSTPQRSADAGFNLVENGVARAIIVTPQNPSGVVKYAVQELQQHIERATGVRVEVLPEKSAAASPLPHRIYLGPSAATQKAGVRADDLPANGFRSKITADAVYLVGKDDCGRADDPTPYGKSWPDFKTGELPLDDSTSMGSLFAAYDWLENRLNARWLWPDETGMVVTKTKVLSSGAVTEKVVRPSLLFAQARLNTWAGMDPARRPKYVHETSVWLRRQRLARSVGVGYGHAYGRYWERFGSTHPEYFALLPSGKREPFNPKRVNLVQMCISNPDFQKQVIADWLEQRERTPSRPWINGCENDRTAMDPPCQCADCRAWDPPNPKPPMVQHNPWLSGHATAREINNWPRISLSDRYAKFWLALQKEGQKHDPDATVIGLAYTEYSDPPVQTRLNKNIVVGIVPAYNYPMSPEESEEFKKVWDGWVATGATLYLRPNNFLTGYSMPFVYPRQFGNDFKYALETGLVGADFDSLVGMWGVQGINLYMMGRLIARPELSVDEILNEYYTAFGPAAADIREYFDFWETVTLQADSEFQRKANGGWSPLRKTGDLIYTPQAFSTAKEKLAKARLSARADGEVLARIGYLDLWLQHADLTMKVVSAFNRYEKTPADPQLQKAFEQAKTTLDDYRSAHADKIVNVGFLNYLESWRRWKPPVARQ